MNNKDIAEQLYWELNRMFSSEHSDTPNEQASGMFELELAVNRGETSAGIEKKMRQMLMVSDGMFKTKLSVLIKNRFWEKQFVQSQPLRRFRPE